MKKLLLIFFIANPIYAFANNSYLGFNINHNSSKHQYSKSAEGYCCGDIDANRIKTDKKNVGFGFEAGYKLNLGEKFYAAPEIFFDQLNNNAEDPIADNDGNFLYKRVRMVLNYRYGAKMNAGYNFNNKFSGFINFGIANLDYDNNVSSNEFYEDGVRSYGNSELSTLYGIGLEYKLTDKISTKFSYDKQNASIRYVSQHFRSRVDLETFKLGLNYNF